MQFDNPLEVARELRAAGLRVTAQRVAILGLLRRDRSHPTAEEVYARLSSAQPGLSRATVYNTLETLVRNGLCRRVPSRDGRQRFDGIAAPHHHLVCTGCGVLHDLPAGTWAVPGLPPDLAPGWHVGRARVTVEGVCPHCLPRHRPAPASP